MARKGVADFVNLDVINSQDALDLFDELKTTVQNQIVYAGLRKSAKIIKDSIAEEYNATQKNKTKSSGQHFKDSLRIEDFKSTNINSVGMKIGMGGFWGFKFRWNESGTVDRYRRKSNKGMKNQNVVKKPFWTGKISATKFFETGITKSQNQAQQAVVDNVNKSFDNTIKRYEKKGKK